MDWRRFLTIVAGVGAGVLGVFVPATAAFALPASAALIGWGTPHPADGKGKSEAK